MLEIFTMPRLLVSRPAASRRRVAAIQRGVPPTERQRTPVIGNRRKERAPVMTVGRPRDGQFPASGREGRAASTAPARTRLPVCVVALIAAVGVLVVAAAFTAGRLGHANSPWAHGAYWLGQVLIVVPVAARLLSRRNLGAGEAVTLVVVLTVAEYLVKICYSPTGFTFGDELAHWRSTVDILQTGKLFQANDLLPISPHYPGLEEVTAALVSISGLSVFVAGLIVVGVAHLLFVLVLYLLFHRISHSHRIAGVAVLLYVSNPLFQSFDSMFVYQTLALAFFGLTLLATQYLSAGKTVSDRGGWLTIAVLAAFATAVTHNVTSYVLVTALVVITLGSLFAQSRPSAAWASVLALVASAAFTGWIVFAAQATASYLGPAVASALQSLRDVFAGAHSGGAAPAAVGPLGNQALSAVTVLAISVLVPVGWWQVWRYYRGQPWVVAMAVGSVSWYVVVAIRLFVADGSELAGRAATFVYIPVGFIAALAVIRLTDSSLRWRVIRANVRRRAPLVVAVAVAGATIFVFDGLANGWPPYWERLPEPHQVAGAELSVGPLEIASAQWAEAQLGPGNTFATDEGDFAVLGGYGDQNPLSNVAFLYTSPTLTKSDIQQAADQAIRYILVDQRLSESLPASGSYFAGDSAQYTRPLPQADLTKFNHVPDVARIYDSGNIVIYHLGEVDYAG
jgi:hypothetical protein